VLAQQLRGLVALLVRRSVPVHGPNVSSGRAVGARGT
jgi:hypothetical protein